MELENTTENQPAAQADDDLAPARESTTGMTRREQRVTEYETNGLERPDPLEACLAALNANLMRTSFALSDVVQEVLDAGPATEETVRRAAGTLDKWLRVNNQIGRFAEFEFRAADARYKAARGRMEMEEMLALRGRPKNASGGIARPSGNQLSRSPK